MSTVRLESFSDGVMAVAITLLALDIGVPNPASTPHLGHALAEQWPVYAAYATSFLTIGIIWINHHVAIGRLARVDHSIVMLNIVLLASVAVIPFGTALLAKYLKQGHGENLAAAVYGGTLMLMAVAFTALNRQILFGRAHLLRTQLSHELRRRIFLRSFSGVIPYVLATALAAVSPYITLGMSAALAAFYATPLSSGIAEER